MNGVGGEGVGKMGGRQEGVNGVGWREGAGWEGEIDEGMGRQEGTGLGRGGRRQADKEGDGG